MTFNSAHHSARKYMFAFLAAFIFGMGAQVALAGHWHTNNGVEHGLQHGSSTTDGSFFGRTISVTANTTFCGVGDTNVYGGSGYYHIGYTNGPIDCSNWSKSHGNNWDECQGVSYNRVYVKLSEHSHYPHNSSPSSCLIIAS